MKLFSKNSNLYDHDTSTSQTDGRTDGQRDRRTTCHGNTALRVASRGKKTLQLVQCQKCAAASSKNKIEEDPFWQLLLLTVVNMNKIRPDYAGSEIRHLNLQICYLTRMRSPPIEHSLPSHLRHADLSYSRFRTSGGH